MGQTQGAGIGDAGGNTTTGGDGNPWLKLLQGGIKGAAQGYSNMQQQNTALRQGGGGMGFAPVNQQQVDPNYFQPQRRSPNNLNFYGEGY